MTEGIGNVLTFNPNRIRSPSSGYKLSFMGLQSSEMILITASQRRVGSGVSRVMMVSRKSI
jgi:hypothetical protein